MQSGADAWVHGGDGEIPGQGFAIYGRLIQPWQVSSIEDWKACWLLDTLYGHAAPTVPA